VYFHQGALFSAASAVDGTRKQLLTRPSLSDDQDRRISLRNPLHLIESFQKNWRAADDLFEVVFGPDFLLQINVFRIQPVLKRFHFDQGHAQFFLGPLSVQLRARAGGERFQNGQAAWALTHGLVIHHNKMADVIAGSSHYRNSQIAEGSKLGKTLT